MISQTRHSRLQPRLLGWLLACTLVLPSLIGWLPMPMRAQAAVPSATTTTQDATARLLADLAVLCTPYGLRLAGHDQPAKPAGKIAHETCVLCGIAAGAALGLLQPEAGLTPPVSTPDSTLALSTAEIPTPSLTLRPPGRGPPN